MKKRYVSGIMLALLLIGMSALTFNLQLANADLKTVENHNKKGSNEQPIVVEHEISSLELEELRRELGVWEEDRNYNQIIDGHGTGLRPPTEEEWAEIASSANVVEEILLDYQSDEALPTSIDHTTSPWFPPIGNQDGEGSCTAWALGYYMKTFQEAKEHGWDLSGAEWLGGYTGFPTTSYQDRIISPDFLYHLINGGTDGGSSVNDAINLICGVGVSSWETMPNDCTDSSSWPSEDAWREAPLYRGNSSGLEYLELNTDEDLTSLKSWLASGNLAVIIIDANEYNDMTTKDLWTLDNYFPSGLNHVNTIVGYTDNELYFEQGEMRLGTFKAANSWGEGGWEYTTDGCLSISYETMKQRIGAVYFYRDKIAYDPKLMASFEMNHSKRGECDIVVGMGNHSSPLATKSFSDLINGGNQPFCSNSIVFDISEFEEAEPAFTNQSFFMQVLDRGIPPGHTWYSDGTAYSWFRLNQTFDVPVTGATLNFLSYYEIEADWDYGYVEVHDLDTGEWYTLPGLKTISTLPEIQDNPNCPAQIEPSAYFGAGRWNAFTGTSAMYVETMDLTAFAGNTIEVYFTYWTDPYVLELGWYIDNIEIPEIGFFDDVESGPGDWTYNGWDIVTPPPPTNGTFLSFSTEYYDSYISGPLNATATSYDVPANTTELGYVFAYAYMHNIETTDIITSKVLVGEGFTSNISVTVVNEGAFTETFNVTVYANETATASQNVTLASGNSTTVTLTWDSTGFAYGNYTISAVADTVTGEAYTSDNTLANGSIMVTIPGDANGDKIVDIFDIGVISAHWYPGPPIGPLGYDANADINNDGAVDIFDIGITSAHWGQTW